MQTGEVNANGVIVLAQWKYLGTDASGSGSPNVENYAVKILEFDFDGVWRGDGRRGVEVIVPIDHPLHGAVSLIAAEKKARRAIVEAKREFNRRGYEREHHDYVSKYTRVHNEALAAMMADPLAVQLLAIVTTGNHAGTNYDD